MPWWFHPKMPEEDTEQYDADVEAIAVEVATAYRGEFQLASNGRFPTLSWPVSRRTHQLARLRPSVPAPTWPGSGPP